MRLDLSRLRTLVTIARSAGAIGGVRALAERLPARELELAVRGRLIARRTAGTWRVLPLGLLRALGTRA